MAEAVVRLFGLVVSMQVTLLLRDSWVVEWAASLLQVFGLLAHNQVMQILAVVAVALLTARVLVLVALGLFFSTLVRKMMAHFAKIENGTVTDLIVIDNDDCGGGQFPDSEPIGQAFIAALASGDPRLLGVWFQTSYNTRGSLRYPGGVAYETLNANNEVIETNGTKVGAFRGNFGQIGHTFDPSIGEHGAFIPPSPYPSWVLDENVTWQAPVPYPYDGNLYSWNEEQQEWEKYDFLAE
jgi:hypothetical protein